MTELNPCPSCGSEPQIGEMTNCFIIGCGNCNEPAHCRAVTANGAMNAWNAATSERSVKALRDEFAMAVISGYMTRESCIHSEYAEWAVTHSYEIADLMLKERSKC